MGSYTFLSASGAVGALCGMPPGRGSAFSLGGVLPGGRCRRQSGTGASKLGAQLLFDPFDVPGMGRGACLADPGGAVFSLWQPASSEGGGLAMLETHAFGWVELATRDADGMRSLLGVQAGPARPLRYRCRGQAITSSTRSPAPATVASCR